MPFHPRPMKPLPFASMFVLQAIILKAGEMQNLPMEFTAFSNP